MENDEINNNVNTTDIQVRYNDFLKKEIEEYCVNGSYELSWDYDDIDTLADNIDKYIADYDGTDDFKSYITDVLTNEFLDNGYFPEDNLETAIRNDIDTLNDDELNNYFNERVDNNQFWDDMYDNGYDGVDYQLDDILNRLDVSVNIMIAPYNEQNYDMGSIITAFGSDYLTASDGTDIEPEYLDNGITYLVHQQGHTLKELFDAIYGKPSDNKFIKSVVQEINNNPAEAMSGLTVLTKINVLTYGNLLQAKKNNSSYVEVPVDTYVGIFNPWIGTGSLFEIELEKPFIFSAGDILNASLDSVTGSGFYSVGDVYGGFSRDTGLSFVDTAPELVQEDLQEVLQYVANEYGGGNNE